MAPSLLILAAGLGTRFGGEKQLTEVAAGGSTLLDFAIHDARRAGFGQTVLVVRPDLEETLRDHLEEQFGSSLEPAFVRQAHPLGTGHAVLCAEEYLNRPFAVANADDFYGRGAYRSLHDGLTEEGEDSFVTVYRLADTLSQYGGVSRAVCRIGENDGLEGITEVLDIRDVDGEIRGRTAAGEARVLTGDEAVSMNLWGLRPQLFPALHAAYERFQTAHPLPSGFGEAAGPHAEFRLSDAMDELVRAAEPRVRVIRVKEEGFGVTYAEDVVHTRARIEAMIERGDYPANLGEAARIAEEA